MSPHSFSAFSHVVIFIAYVTGDLPANYEFVNGCFPLPHIERNVNPNHALNQARCLARCPHRFVYH